MHTLPELPYTYNALEPFIDEATMRLHHDKHHQTYVDKLNAALASYPDYQNDTVEELLSKITNLPDALKTRLTNHGGGHANHTLFWQTLTPQASAKPSGAFAQAINEAFDNFDTFKNRFSELAINHFGSGWAWLAIDQNTGDSRIAPTLSIYSLPNQDSPLMQGHTPLLGIDVWEHAYYLKYQNRRAEYVENIWNIINWPQIEKQYETAINQ